MESHQGLGAVCTDAVMYVVVEPFWKSSMGGSSLAKEETKRNVAASALDAKWYGRDLTAHACEMMF